MQYSLSTFYVPVWKGVILMKVISKRIILLLIIATIALSSGSTALASQKKHDDDSGIIRVEFILPFLLWRT